MSLLHVGIIAAILVAGLVISLEKWDVKTTKTNLPKKLLEFLLTDKGQEYVEIGGSVPIME